MPPVFKRKKKKKDEEEARPRLKKKTENKGKKLKKKEKKKLEIHPEIKTLMQVRGDKNKFVRDLSVILTSRAGYPVRVIYHRSLDRKFNTKRIVELGESFGINNALPFQRIVETDTPLGDYATFLFIIISDGAFKSEKLLSEMAQRMYLRW